MRTKWKEEFEFVYDDRERWKSACLESKSRAAEAIRLMDVWRLVAQRLMDADPRDPQGWEYALLAFADAENETRKSGFPDQEVKDIE